MIGVFCTPGQAALVSLGVSPDTQTTGTWTQGQLIEIVLQIDVTGNENQGFSGADFKGAGRGLFVDTDYLKIHDVLFNTIQVDTQTFAQALDGMPGYEKEDDTWWHDPFTDFTGTVDFTDSSIQAVAGAPVEAGFELGLAGPIGYLHLVLEVQAGLADPWISTDVSFAGQLVSYDLVGPNQVDIFGTLSEPGQNIGSGGFTINSQGFFGAEILSAVITNWGLTGATRAQGDLNGDGTVGGIDYTMVITYWGANGGPPPQPAPEPATLIFLLAGALAALLPRSPANTA